MPGELGDETEQPNAGYYERRYKTNDEWMIDSYGSLQNWKDHNKGKSTQIQRILDRLRNKKDK